MRCDGARLPGRGWGLGGTRAHGPRRSIDVFGAHPGFFLCTADPWWSVDLGSAVPLKYVEITATAAGAKGLEVRLGNSTVQYGPEGVAVQPNLLYLSAGEVSKAQSRVARHAACAPGLRTGHSSGCTAAECVRHSCTCTHVHFHAAI